jgi:hypothetical protein
MVPAVEEVNWMICRGLAVEADRKNGHILTICDVTDCAAKVAALRARSVAFRASSAA